MMVMWLTGKRMLLLFTAARTRSRASFTAASGSPTTSKPGSPLEIKASAVTRLPMMPLMHMVRTLQIIFPPLFGVLVVFCDDTICQFAAKYGLHA